MLCRPAVIANDARASSRTNNWTRPQLQSHSFPRNKSASNAAKPNRDAEIAWRDNHVGEPEREHHLTGQSATKQDA
jgi:hypothetical protein